MNGSAIFHSSRGPRSAGLAGHGCARDPRGLEAAGATRPGAPGSARALERPARRSSGFTLAELLVVIVIMGILAGLTVPGIRSMSRSNATSAADRQLLDDLAYARQRAIAQHTTVYVVFVPPNLGNTTVYPPIADPATGTVLSNLYGGRFTTYALLSLRSVGEQPGQAHPRYLTTWRSLPEGVFIATNKFRLDVKTDPYYNDPLRRMFSTTSNFVFNSFLFPVITNTLPAAYSSANVRLPYLAFDYRGQLLSGRDEYIPLAPGSVAFPRGKDGNYLAGSVSVLEQPAGNTMYDSSYPNNAFNQIHIDWLTGRARVEKAEIR